MVTSIYSKITIKSVKDFQRSLSESERLSATRRDDDCYLRDTRLQGFYLRVRPSGKATYVLQSRLHGRKRSWTIGDQQIFSATDASETAAEWLRLIKKGLDPKLEAQKQAHARSDYPIKEVVELYCQQKMVRSTSLRETTKKSYRDAINRNAKAWANKDIRDLTVEDLDDWYYKKQNGKDIFPQKRKTLRTIKTVINWAIKRHIIKDTKNVATIFVLERLGGFPDDDYRTRHIEPHEKKDWLRSFVSQAKPHPRYYDKETKIWARVDARDQKAIWNKKPTISHTQRDYILFMLVTGRRSGEASQLCWSDLAWSDEEMHTYVIQADIAKGRRKNRIPMTPLIDAMFKWRSEQPDRHKELVFPNRLGTGPIKDPRKSLEKICHYEEEKSGFSFDMRRDGKRVNIRPHDLRRTTSTYAYEAGIGYEEMKTVLTHARPTLQQQYVVSNSYRKERDYLETTEREIVGHLYYWLMVNWYGAADFLLEYAFEQPSEPKWGFYEKHYSADAQYGDPKPKKTT